MTIVSHASTSKPNPAVVFVAGWTYGGCGISGARCPHPILLRFAPQHMVRLGIIFPLLHV